MTAAFAFACGGRTDGGASSTDAPASTRAPSPADTSTPPGTTSSADTPTLHSTACATGPAAYGPSHPGAYPPRLPWPADAASLPTCAPRCGETMLPPVSWPAEYGIEALPTGSCVDEGDRCQMAAGSTQTCGTDTHTCDYSDFECICQGGSWQCFSISQGGGVCGPCLDGGGP